MKKIFLLFISCFLFASCELVFFYLDPQSNNPVKDNFSYYQKDFILDKNQSELKTNGIYERVEYAVVDQNPKKDTLNWVYRFYDGGQVYKRRYVREKYDLNNLDKVQRIYYKIKGDSIYLESFTTGRKEFWYWSGTIKGDTFHLTSVKGEGNKKRGYKAPKKIDEIYIFKPIPELNNSIEPNW